MHFANDSDGTRVYIDDIYNIQGNLGYKNGSGYYYERREIFRWNIQEWILEWSK